MRINLFQLALLLIAPLLSQAALELQFDFGNAQLSPGETWNNVPANLGYEGQPSALNNLVNASGQVTNASLTVTSIANGPNFLGTESSSIFPSTATYDNIFGNIPEAGNSLSNVTPGYTLDGLIPGTPYDFVFYASRMEVADNRETRYILTGFTTEFVDFNPSNNVDGFAQLTNVLPNALGEIQLEVTQGPNNDNAFSYTYLGVMTVTPVPEPGSFACAVAMAVLAAAARRRRT